MRIRYAATLLATIVLVAGCSGSDNGPTDPTSGNGAGSIPSTPGVGSFKALFVASIGVFPYPTDGYFLFSDDGTLNIPSAVAFSPLRTQVNALDGWSTTASSFFRMSQAVKNDAVMLNSSVRVIEMVMLRQASGPYAPVAPSPLRGANPVLVPGVDYSVRLSPDADTLGSVIEIQWLKPLNASQPLNAAGTVFCPAPLPSQAICGIGYVVLVTNGIQSTSSVAATPDIDYLTIRTEAIAELGRAAQSGSPATYVPTCPGITNPTLKTLCQLTYAHLATGAQLPPPATVDPTKVIVSYSFTTQSTRDALVRLSQVQTAAPITAVPTGKTTADLLPPALGSPGYAAAYAGSLQVPYYLSPPPAEYTAPNSTCNLFSATNPLVKPWNAAGASTVPGISATSRHVTRFNLAPEKKADVTIPMLVFRPSGASPSGGEKPANGWPVVVFMHGLGGDRTNAAFIADAYASRGFVVVAIDQVLHGITSTTNSLYAGAANPAAALLYPAGTRERTFDIDCITTDANNLPAGPAPDGKVDPSGFDTIFIGVPNPIVTRDIFRQTGSDMITLVKSLPNLDLDGDTVGDIDLTQVHYAGASLGGIIGPACVCTEMKSYYLNVAGGPYADIARTSQSYSPLVNTILAGAGLSPGNSLYTQYFREALALVDSGDPVNYVKRLAQDRPVLFTKVIGDPTVPNPNNDYLIRAAGGTMIAAPTPGLYAVSAGAPKFVSFLTGSHGSLLSPAGGVAATQEMQTHAASLVATAGTAIQVANPSVLEQPAP